MHQEKIMSNLVEPIINKYIWKQFELNGAANVPGFSFSTYGGVTPIFPVSDNKSGDAKWGPKPYIIYDSFMKGRVSNKYFYPVKCAQMMYSIRGASLEEIFYWRDFIINIADREDRTAFDVNQFAGQNIQNNKINFHCINASQVNYVGNTTETAGLQKTFSTNVVIKYDYHATDIYNNG
jgi:hypothetical protein